MFDSVQRTSDNLLVYICAQFLKNFYITCYNFLFLGYFFAKTSIVSLFCIFFPLLSFFFFGFLKNFKITYILFSPMIVVNI